MHIGVLAKVVPDYEVPAGDFELVSGKAHERYQRMIGLYDENAIELAVQLKEKYEAMLTIFSYGRDDDVQVLRKAVAMGGDNLVLITGEADDPFVIASNLKMAIENAGDVDLVLAGRQSADMDRGIVPGILAEMMSYTFIPQISCVENIDGDWIVNQITETGSREMKFSGKGVLSITSVPENVPRIPAVRAIFSAKKKPVSKIPEISGDKMSADKISVEIPVLESVCEFLSVDDPDQTAMTLLKKLRGERYL